jgi:hypothetical protein
MDVTPVTLEGKHVRLEPTLCGGDRHGHYAHVGNCLARAGNRRHVGRAAVAADRVQYGGEYPQLRHAFEMLGCVRVEFKTDSLNAKSRAALLRIGAVEEGTMRNHIIMSDGRFRNSVYFSVIESEWPAVKARLEGMLAL